MDCRGVWGGSSFIEDGCCVEINSVCTKDCAGQPGGQAVVNVCGLCSGPGTNLTATSGQDCAGTCSGKAKIDACNTCYGGKTGQKFNQEKDCQGAFCPATRLPVPVLLPDCVLICLQVLVGEAL